MPDPTTPSDWHQLKAIFQAALELTPADRPVFLERACRGGEELRRSVEQLLASHEQAASFLTGTPVVAVPPAGADTEPTSGSSGLPVGTGDMLDGKYRIGRALGAGGMGVVFEATHVGLHRRFALKLINAPAIPGSELFLRFKREAEALGKLTHPHIVTVTDFGVDQQRGLPYLVMEFLEGITLADYCRHRGAISLDEAWPLLDQMASAIDYAHEHGVFHRDLKPANVFLQQKPSAPPTVKIVDFGVSQLVTGTAALPESDQRDVPAARERPQRGGDFATDAAAVTARGAILGTPAYIPPELTRGDPATFASDIYSFGVVIYELVVGSRPFGGSPLEMIESHRTVEPPEPSTVHVGLPHELNEPLLAPLAKNPSARPRSATAVVNALRSAAAAASVRLWRRVQLPRRLAIAVGLALLLAGVSPFLWRLDFVERLEQRTVDQRFAVTPGRQPDARVLLLALDDATLAADARPLADVERGEEFGRAIDRLFDAGARGVAIDLLLPQSWSSAPALARAIVRHAGSLTLAASSSPDGRVIGPEVTAGLITLTLGPSRAADLFGFVNVETDVDGVVRRSRFRYRDAGGQERETWAARAARALRPEADPPSELTARLRSRLLAPVDNRFWIDYSVERGRLDRLSWLDLTTTIERQPDRFRDRLVLVGGEFIASGDEQHRVPPVIDERISGLVVQALVVNTILSGVPIRNVRSWPVLAGVGISLALVAAAILCWPRLFTAIGFGVALTAMYAVAAFVLFVAVRGVLPLAGPVGVLVLAMGVAAALRFRLGPVPVRHTVRSIRAVPTGDDVNTAIARGQ